MLLINRKKLISLLEEAYRYGETGSAECWSSLIKDWLPQIHSSKWNFNFVSLINLMKLSQGNKIFHSLAGEGEITLNNNSLVAVFRNPSRTEKIDFDNAEFWSYPVVTPSCQPKW